LVEKIKSCTIALKIPMKKGGIRQDFKEGYAGRLPGVKLKQKRTFGAGVFPFRKDFLTKKSGNP